MKPFFTIAFAILSISSAFGQQTYLPDNNFEQALIFEGLDTVLDDSIPTSVIDTLTSLNLEPFGIVDLTGIEDFVALKSLVCRNNDIQQLDLSSNPMLEFLNCENNELTNLYVNNCASLKHIFSENNNLTVVNVSQCTVLETLDLSQNPLVSGNFIFQNIALKTVRFSNCGLTSSNFIFNVNLDILDISTNPQLGSLDITACSELTALDAHNCGLTELDLSNNSLIKTLFLMNNSLLSLDLQNNTEIESLICHNNDLNSLILPSINTSTSVNLATVDNPDLFCIQCDNPAYVNTNWSVNIDSFTQIATVCSLDLEELESKPEIFPNPTENGWISVKSEISGRYHLIGLNGKLLKEGEIKMGTTVLDFLAFGCGMYVLQLNLNGQLITRRIELL